MSKSIYEDAFNHLDELVDALAHIEGSFLYRHYLDNIRLKLKQAQEKDKLLELYKQALTGDLGEFIINSQKQEKFLDLYRKFYKYYDNLTLDNLMDTKNKLRELKIKIKELENDK